MVEYALLVAPIAIVSLTAVRAMGSATEERLDNVVVALGEDHVPGPGLGGTTPTTTPGPGPTTPTTTPTTPPTNTASTSSYYWWNSTKDGGNGAWKAAATYQNEWIRHQYLTLEVTRVDEKGRQTVTTVNNFYVGAGGSATYELWDNSMAVNNGAVTGVVSVSVNVVAIRTSDESWQTVSYTTDGPATVVAAPRTP